MYLQFSSVAQSCPTLMIFHSSFEKYSGSFHVSISARFKQCCCDHLWAYLLVPVCEFLWEECGMDMLPGRVLDSLVQAAFSLLAP